MRAMKILVVDDERAVRESLRRALELEGSEVELACDGEGALARLDGAPPADAAILDVLMPGIDGLEVCRRLRAEGDRVPVLMLTARAEMDSRVAGLEAGANDCLPKPSHSRSCSRSCARFFVVRRTATRPGASFGSRISSSIRDAGGSAWRPPDRADAYGVRLLERSSGTRGRFSRGRSSSSVCGGTTSARPRTRWTSTSATFVVRPRRGPLARLIHTVRGIGYALREG